MTDLTQERPPSFNLSTIFNRRDRLYSVLVGYVGQQVSQAEIRAIASSVSPCLPGVANPTLIESLRTLAGVTMDHNVAFDLAWRLAGNLDQLKLRHAVHPWAGQRHDEWVPATVLNAHYERRYGRPGYNYLLRVLAGTSCGLDVRQYWTSKFTYVLAQHIGFTRYSKTIRFRHPLELVNMRFLLLFTPESCAHELRFAKLACAPNFATHNRELTKARGRVGFTCPCDYTHACYVCSVGYDICPVAVLPRTLEVEDGRDAGIAGTDDGTDDGTDGGLDGSGDDSAGTTDALF